MENSNKGAVFKKNQKVWWISFYVEDWAINLFWFTSYMVNLTFRKCKEFVYICCFQLAIVRTQSNFYETST